MKMTLLAAGFLSLLLLASCSRPVAAQNATRSAGDATNAASTGAPGGARATSGATGGTKEAAAIVPDFSLTKTDLRRMAATMPSSIQQAIEARPARFLDEMAAILKQPAIYFVLVDKQHALPPDYVPPDLVNLHEAGLSVSRIDLVLRKSIMPHLLAMVHRARQDHVVLLFSSTYRSYRYQRQVYDQEVRLYGKKVADTESAVPGTSQHQLGDTIDFGCICDAFEKTDAFRWLTDHAAAFGFSMTYPKGMESVTGYRYESWHWHFITTAGTIAQADFFDNVQQYLLVFLYQNRSRLVESYLGAEVGPGWKEKEIVTPLASGDPRASSSS